jgi:hypothetical protein
VAFGIIVLSVGASRVSEMVTGVFGVRGAERTPVASTLRWASMPSADHGGGAAPDLALGTDQGPRSQAPGSLPRSGAADSGIPESGAPESAPLDGGADRDAGDSHWVRWHLGYEDPGSNLSLRLRNVQRMVAEVFDGAPRPGSIRVVSMCAGQGRDVIDVVSTHPRRADVSALLVELDPALVAFAQQRASSAGVGEYVRVEQGDASLCRSYAEHVPADLVLVCGVFGNISASDIAVTIQALPGFCRPGGHVIWTRHRRSPNATPSIRAEFAASGFEEIEFVAPESTVMTVGHHRLEGPTAAFDPDRQLFDFVGDGFMPA